MKALKFADSLFSETFLALVYQERHIQWNSWMVLNERLSEMELWFLPQNSQIECPNWAPFYSVTAYFTKGSEDRNCNLSAMENKI